jgi:hypothetical protein
MIVETKRRYRPTESKYKGGATEMYVTYDLEQRTRGGGTAVYPKVARVYIAGEVTDWQVGEFTKQSGRKVHGVKVDYEQTREGYTRAGYRARRESGPYEVQAVRVRPSTSHFTKIVEVPRKAKNVSFRETLPPRYRQALQSVR